MPNWDQGYHAEQPYTKQAFNFLSPAYINAALAFSGHAAPDITGPFAYCDLGSGFGLSVAGWAAQYPQGEFHSVDFNPGQCAWQLNLKKAAGLDNLHVHERSFGQMLDERLPQFDYVVIHGIYSWVVPEVRQDIIAFLAKSLKPGGVAYVSYNCQPQWGMAEPLRRIIVEARRATGEADDAKALAQGLNFLKELRDSGALYFKAGNQPSVWLNYFLKEAEKDPLYLAGELLSAEHKAFFFSEVAADMAEAGAAYAGSADISEYLDGFLAPQPVADRLNQVGGDISLHGMARDMLYDNAFRRDIYAKGRPVLSDEDAAKAVDGVRAVLAIQKPAELKPMTINGVEARLVKEVFGPAIDALAKGPRTVAGMAKEAGLANSAARQAAAVLLALGWAQACPPEPNPERTKKLNMGVLDAMKDEPSQWLLSPVGGFTETTGEDALFMQAIALSPDPARYAFEAVKAAGWTVKGKTGAAPDALLRKTVEGQMAEYEKKLRPIMGRMGWL